MPDLLTWQKKIYRCKVLFYNALESTLVLRFNCWREQRANWMKRVCVASGHCKRVKDFTCRPKVSHGTVIGCGWVLWSGGEGRVLLNLVTTPKIRKEMCVDGKKEERKEGAGEWKKTEVMRRQKERERERQRETSDLLVTHTHTHTHTHAHTEMQWQACAFALWHTHTSRPGDMLTGKGGG